MPGLRQRGRGGVHGDAAQWPAAGAERERGGDELRDQNEDIDRDDVAQRFDADFILMTGELAALIQNLVEGLGGEAQR